VATLFEGTVPPGSYSVKLDARDLPPGLYLYSLQGGRSVIAKKMTIK
jgi:hypothetical protein